MKTLATSFALLIAAVTFSACSTQTIDPVATAPRAVHITKPDSVRATGRLLEDDTVPTESGREKPYVLSDVPVSTVKNPNSTLEPVHNPAPVRGPRQDVMPVEEAVN